MSNRSRNKKTSSSPIKTACRVAEQVTQVSTDPPANTTKPHRPRKKTDIKAIELADAGVMGQPQGLAPKMSLTKKSAKKNVYAVALGRLGGKKGGRVRAANLSKAELSESARKAAKARWAKAHGTTE